MRIEGLELDIEPSTLEEWDKLSATPIKDGIKAVFTDRQDFNHVVPIGYVKDLNTPKYSIPVPEKQHIILQVLDRCRFQETLTLVDGCSILRREDMSISPQSLQNAMDRLENILGILPELPESISAKARDNRQRLEWRRKRRVAKSKQDKAKELKAQKKAIEQELAKETRRRIDDAKSARMTADEVDGIDHRIAKLKKDSKNSRFSSEGVVTPDQEVIFEPTPKQAEFLAAPEKVVFYGGAAGGGKSFALIFDAIRYAHRPAMRALILRRRNSELKELISVSKQFYTKLFPGAKFNTTAMIWTFPSGATLEFGYFDKADDKERYIGLPYSYIAWDEIQLQKSPEGFDFLFSRLRTTDPEITTYVRCTGNPGGAPWVKQRFIDPAPYNTPFKRIVGGDKESAVTYKFIPATLFDNPYLTQDGEYEKVLRQMNKTKVQQLLYGNWDVMEDSFFNFDQDIHVTSQLPERHWPIYCAMDYGWNDPASTIWARVDPRNGNMYVYQELEVIQNTVDQWAGKMREAEHADPYSRRGTYVIDASLFKMTGHTGPSHLETLGKYGFHPRRADRNREAGWEQVNQRLVPGIDGTPGLYIHESCTKLIDQLMTATARESNPNDIDESRMYSHGRRHHWDLLDSLRYLCMSRPRQVTQDSLLNMAKTTSSWEQYNNYFR